MLTDLTRFCPPELVEDSYLAKTGHCDLVWAEVSRHIPASLLTHLTDCVFILLKPDAIKSGKHEILLRRISEAGWQPVHAHATLTATARHFEELYKYNLTVRNEQNMVGEWWINARLYEMAPSVAFIFRIPPDGARSAHQQVKHMKGPSDPFLGTPGELRFEAGGANVALNLLHSADDPISTLREFLIFGSADQLAEALRRADNLARSVPGARPLPNACIAEQIFLAGPADYRLDLASALTVVKSRIRVTEDCPALHAATASLYRSYRALWRSGLGTQSRWERFRLLSIKEAQILARLAGRGCCPYGHRLLDRLATPSDFRFETAEEIRFELMRRQINVDPWYALAVQTGLYYHKSLP